MRTLYSVYYYQDVSSDQNAEFLYVIDDELRGQIIFTSEDNMLKEFPKVKKIDDIQIPKTKFNELKKKALQVT